MTPNPITIEALTQLGYTIGIAHGDAQVEQEALDAAGQLADPGRVAADAAAVASATVANLAAAGALPDTVSPEQLFTKIASEVFSKLQVVRSEAVEFHERALAIAQETPTVWRVEGPGVSVCVSAKDDGTGWDDGAQALIDALANPAAIAEGQFQIDRPDAMADMQTLIGVGREVDRPTPGADVFVVDGTEHTSDELAVLVADLT